MSKNRLRYRRERALRSATNGWCSPKKSYSIPRDRFIVHSSTGIITERSSRSVEPSIEFQHIDVMLKIGQTYICAEERMKHKYLCFLIICFQAGWSVNLIQGVSGIDSSCSFSDWFRAKSRATACAPRDARTDVAMTVHRLYLGDKSPIPNTDKLW